MYKSIILFMSGNKVLYIISFSFIEFEVFAWKIFSFRNTNSEMETLDLVHLKLNRKQKKKLIFPYSEYIILIWVFFPLFPGFSIHKLCGNVEMLAFFKSRICKMKFVGKLHSNEEQKKNWKFYKSINFSTVHFIKTIINNWLDKRVLVNFTISNTIHSIYLLT